MAKTKPKPKPQTTIVRVAVTTEGPVSMKAVREWVAAHVAVPGYRHIGIAAGDRLIAVTKVAVKRDADIERR